MSEFSTPFVNLRWMLQQIGKRESPIYALNRKLTVSAFFLVRIIPIPVYWFVVGWTWYYNQYTQCDIPIKLIMAISGQRSK